MPKIVDHDAFKRELAEKAIEIFRRKGYRDVSFRSLAKELGISKSGLYHYFDDKDDLFKHCGELLFESTMPEVKRDDGKTAAEQIVEMAKTLEDGFGSEVRLLIDLMETCANREETAKGIYSILDRFEETLSIILSRDHFYTVLRLIFGELLLRALDTRIRSWDKFIQALIFLTEETV